MGNISPAFVSITGTVTIATQSSFTPQAQITIAPGGSDTIPANASRKRVTVMNVSSGVDPVWLSSTDDTEGTQLVPGVWIDIYDTAAIPLFVAATAAANVTVGYIEYE